MADYNKKRRSGNAKCPKRGDVFFAELSEKDVIGSEERGRRPVLILQNNAGNLHSPTTIVAILTTQEKHDLPTHVKFSNPDILPYSSLICMEQIQTIDKTRLKYYCGNVGTAMMMQVEVALMESLGISNIEDKYFVKINKR